MAILFTASDKENTGRRHQEFKENLQDVGSWRIQLRANWGRISGEEAV